MMRVLIDDSDPATYSYTDTRIEQILVVAAQYVQHEISFTTTYTIDIGTPDITPDPTVTATKDDPFTNFTVLKAACLTDWSTFRQKALISGVKARCGPVILETLKHMDGFKTLLEEGPCAAYEELKKDWQYGNVNVIKAILSPFVGNSFDPRSIHHTHIRRAW